MKVSKLILSDWFVLCGIGAVISGMFVVYNQASSGAYTHWLRSSTSASGPTSAASFHHGGRPGHGALRAGHAAAGHRRRAAGNPDRHSSRGHECAGSVG